MLSGLYIKLIASGIILAIVAGGYFYVTGLQKRNAALTGENVTLRQANSQLGETIKDQNKQITTMDKVIKAGDAAKEENRIVYRDRLINIDKGVKQGKDRPVGPLLKEFLNG